MLGIDSTEVSWKALHVSARKGPSGHATMSSLNELRGLPPELVASIKLLGGDALSKFIDDLIVCRVGADLTLLDAWASLHPTKSSRYRKLSHFADKEGKTRVVAILDYWSQTALQPLHRVLNGMLAKLAPQDCTFNQGSFRLALPSEGPYWSIDLTNATDRMPIAVQQRVISRIIGEARASA